MASSEILKAYQNTFKVSLPSRSNGEIPGIPEVHLNEREAARYAIQGIANINISAENMAPSQVFDLSALIKINEPTFVWMKKSPRTLKIRISCTTTDVPDKAIQLDRERAPRGLYIETTPVERVKTEAQYDAKIIPLYAKPKNN